MWQKVDYLLGICLGMQLLFDESEENGPAHGLSLIPGKVVRFSGMDAKKKRIKCHIWAGINLLSPIFSFIRRT